MEPAEVKTLMAMGDWLKERGESIYGTRGGPFVDYHDLTIKTRFWFRTTGEQLEPNVQKLVPVTSTRKGKTIYVHVLRWDGDAIELPPIPRKIVAHGLQTAGSATVDQTDKGIRIAVPAAERDALDTIIKLELDGSAMDLPTVRIKGIDAPSLTTGKKASAQKRKSEKHAPEKAVDGDAGKR